MKDAGNMFSFQRDVDTRFARKFDKINKYQILDKEHRTTPAIEKVQRNDFPRPTSRSKYRELTARTAAITDVKTTCKNFT
ncbi:hypothetical protein [Sulfitobacter geojensis]|uniref:hypothetical protein n=1 Tax=Sulfitobacter geojensis TaxID=1342299 RepID=UPI0036D85DE7